MIYRIRFYSELIRNSFKKTTIRPAFVVLNILITAVVWRPCPASGVTIEVPADFKTINKAIDEAFNQGGGEVIVSPGTYYETVILKSNVTVKSLNLDKVNTIIDGKSTSQCVQVETGCRNAILSGFTLQNGWGDYGGGISIRNSGEEEKITVKHSTTKNCKAYFGGGLYAYNDANITFKDCKIIDTKANIQIGDDPLDQFGLLHWRDYGYGGAIYTNECFLEVKDCSFKRNQAQVGGAVWFNEAYMHWDYPDETIEFANCLFEDNFGKLRGGGDIPVKPDVYTWELGHPQVRNSDRRG